MVHQWMFASAESILGNIWVADSMKIALMKPTYVPNPDTQKFWADVSAQELAAGAGYTAGGITLATKSQAYNAATDRTDLKAADVSWGPGATFDAAFAVIYDAQSGVAATMPLWSLVDFQGTKSVAAGVFTISWAVAGVLYIVPG